LLIIFDACRRSVDVTITLLMPPLPARMLARHDATPRRAITPLMRFTLMPLMPLRACRSGHCRLRR